MIAFKKRRGRPLAAEIDLGLELLLVLRRPRATLGQSDIAAWCGCSREYIRQVELKALVKLRNALRDQRLVAEMSETAPKMMADEAPKEIRLKDWLKRESVRQGIKPQGVYSWLRRHPEQRPPMRRVNQRVVMVQVAA